MKLSGWALTALTMTASAFAGEGHQFTVTGRPAIMDPPPPMTSVPYVDVFAISYTWTDQVLNPGFGSQTVMQGTCQQSIRLTVEEAQELVTALQAWIVTPEEELTLFDKSFHVPGPSAPPPVARRR